MALVVGPSKDSFWLLIIVFICVLLGLIQIQNHSAEVSETGLTSDIFTTSLDLAKSALASLNDGDIVQAKLSLTNLRKKAQKILTKANEISIQLKRKEMDMVHKTESLEGDLGKLMQILRELNDKKIVIGDKMENSADMLSRQEGEVWKARRKVDEARDKLERARSDKLIVMTVTTFVGGVVGAIFGGPPGALFGATLGGGGGALLTGSLESAKRDLNSKEKVVHRSINDLNQLRNNLKSIESEMKPIQQRINSLEEQISQYQSELSVVRQHVAVIIKTKNIFEQLDYKTTNADEWTEILQKMLEISSGDNIGLESEGISITKDNFKSAWDDLLKYVDNH